MGIMKPWKILAAALFLALIAAPAGAEVSVSYLYKLSNFDGPVPYDSPRIFADNSQGEVFVISEIGVGIFNSRGMETFQIENDPAVGLPIDAVVVREGDIIMLSLLANGYQLVRCNYRGELLARIELKNVPAAFNAGSFGRIAHYKDQLYLLDNLGMRVVVVDLNGVFIKGYDIFSKLGLPDEERENQGIGGFNLDREGNILFTLPVVALAYLMTPDGKVREFGRRGSAPGKFGVPSGIAGDARGNLLVTDKLRCMVLVFDKNFRFVKEFGYRGFRPHNLIVPGEIAVDSLDRVYVGQLRRRGVNVYQLEYN